MFIVLTLLTIIVILLVILITVIYQMIKELKGLPVNIMEVVLIPFQTRIKKLSEEIKKVKDDLGVD
jgi:predicted PurR-regulated permease PerM